jgi:hypothetical protein
MERLRSNPLCQALDQGDVLLVAQMAGMAHKDAQRARERVGDCGLCRLAFARLARRTRPDWIQIAPLSAREATFYGERLGSNALLELL